MACLCAIHFDVYPCVNLPFQKISGLPHRRCLQESQEFASAVATLPSQFLHRRESNHWDTQHESLPKGLHGYTLLTTHLTIEKQKIVELFGFRFWLKATLNLQESARYVHPKLFKGVQVSLSNRPPPSTSTVCNRVTEKAVWFVMCLSPVVWFVTKAPQSAFAELPGPWPEWRRLKSRANHPFHATNQNRNIYYFAMYLGKTCWISGYFPVILGRYVSTSNFGLVTGISLRLQPSPLIHHPKP